MRRGEIRMVDLDPVRGNDANKTRPVVVVSNDPRPSRSGRSLSNVLGSAVAPSQQP